MKTEQITKGFINKLIELSGRPYLECFHALKNADSLEEALSILKYQSGIKTYKKGMIVTIEHSMISDIGYHNSRTGRILFSQKAIVDPKNPSKKWLDQEIFEIKRGLMYRIHNEISIDKYIDKHKRTAVSFIALNTTAVPYRYLNCDGVFEYNFNIRPATKEEKKEYLKQRHELLYMGEE